MQLHIYLITGISRTHIAGMAEMFATTVVHAGSTLSNFKLYRRVYYIWLQSMQNLNCKALMLPLPVISYKLWPK